MRYRLLLFQLQGMLVMHICFVLPPPMVRMQSQSRVQQAAAVVIWCCQYPAVSVRHLQGQYPMNNVHSLQLCNMYASIGKPHELAEPQMPFSWTVPVCFHMHMPESTTKNKEKMQMPHSEDERCYFGSQHCRCKLSALCAGALTVYLSESIEVKTPKNLTNL